MRSYDRAAEAPIMTTISAFSDIDFASLPIPKNDGAAEHLLGMVVPPVALAATDGNQVDLSRLPGRTLLYACPRTGTPEDTLPPGWDAIPGARGCTPQTCAFRDHFSDLRLAGIDQLFGISTQSPLAQRDAVDRLRLPFSLLSDAAFDLTQAMILPSFEAGGYLMLKRFTLVIDGGRVSKVFYPIFPPDLHAQEVLDWLTGEPF
jgi:peroxiredoxin